MLHDTHLLAIEMNPKPCLLSQNIHLFKNCVNLKKTSGRCPGFPGFLSNGGFNIFQKHEICEIATNIWKSLKLSFLSFLLNWIFSTTHQILWNCNNRVNHSFTVFCFVLGTQCMKSNETKWITWPMSRHNFHVLWPNLVKCADRAWWHQM